MDHEKKEMNNKNNLNNNIKLDENILQQNKLFVSNEDDKTANDEYNKCVVKALKEAIDENEMVKRRFLIININLFKDFIFFLNIRGKSVYLAKDPNFSNWCKYKKLL